ncbi:MAG TPA: alcohol dehydrogenase catalytic domain-containing protein [Dehalococcoidia bacterium]
MKAALFHGPHQPLTIEEVQIDRPAKREVLVRTAASGVCHSDLHFVEGLWVFPPPAVLGHEAAGVVEEVGEDVTYVKPGDHVIACLSVFCGHCDDCLTGHPNRCSNPETRRGPDEPPRLSQDGKPVNQFLNVSSYAEKMLLHENAIVKIRDDVPLDTVALIGCGVLTRVGAALNTARVEPGSTVAVFGAGGVGLPAIQGARIAAARRSKIYRQSTAYGASLSTPERRRTMSLGPIRRSNKPTDPTTSANARLRTWLPTA